MCSNNKKTAVYFLIAVFFIALDRLLKTIALNGISFNLINDFFKFNFAKNYFIAFSIPITGLVLNLIVFIIIASIIYYLFKLYSDENFTEFNILFYVLLGASSNFYDRLIYGYVIDYFDLNYFTVFNLADVMIVCGVIWFGWLNFRKEKI